MSSNFNNYGNVGIMGEQINNHGIVNGQQIGNIEKFDWNSIRDEIKILSRNNIDNSVIQGLNEATEKEDGQLLKVVINAANLTREFLISLGASLLASFIVL